MKINVYYTKKIHYKDAPDGCRQWRFYFERYKFIKGFRMRIFGVYFNVREKNATAKLIKMFNAK